MTIGGRTVTAVLVAERRSRVTKCPSLGGDAVGVVDVLVEPEGVSPGGRLRRSVLSGVTAASGRELAYP